MAKTFDELHNERFGYNAASCTGYCANESKYSTYQYRGEGYFLREAEVTALQAKLLEAEAACAGLVEWSKVFIHVDHHFFHEPDECSECRAIIAILHTPNPGTHLIARLQAADELAKASAHLLRACASSVPGVFSNAQFALGEKLEAYKTAKEAG